MSSDNMNATVAVIGTGPAGLAAMKNLLDEGFQVTAFEQRSVPGGVWAFTEDPTVTSITTATKVQHSKFMLPFSDLAMPDDYPRHIPGFLLGEYYERYAQRYNLADKVVFNTSVQSIRRDDNSDKWRVYIDKKPEALLFDKIVYAVGADSLPNVPKIENLESFRGIVLHGQAYKRPSQFDGMNVLVLGQGNSATDCVVEVAALAKKAYLARRRGSIVLPRVVAGKRIDALVSWKFGRMMFWLSSHWRSAYVKLMSTTFSSMMSRAWQPQGMEDLFGYGVRPEYAGNVVGTVISDDLIPALRDGLVHLVPGVRKVIGPSTLQMDDGSVLDDIDAIIMCTGYRTSFEPLAGMIDFTVIDPQLPLQPDLYQNIFSPRYPHSLACLNFVQIHENAATTREVAAMAVAQIFAGKSQLPSVPEMLRQIRDHQAWYLRRCQEETIRQPDGMLSPAEWLRFIHTTAGTGMYEYLGWTWRGLWFSLTQPKLYLTLAWGLGTPHALRFFETGKRKAWPEAREAVLKANELSKKDLALSKELFP